MTSERSCDRPRRCRVPVLLCLLVVASTASSCRFLADEFAWLDRRAPSTLVAPDAPVSGLTEQP